MRLRAVLDSTGRSLRRLSTMVFRRNAARIFTVPRSAFDFLGAVGNGTGSSTVAAPLLWVARTLPEAPPMMWRQREDGQEEADRAHPILKLLRRPNSFHTGPVLWMATSVDWLVDGNAYWLKLRDGTGSVRELWWTPSWSIEPAGDEKTYIDHYVYRPGGTTEAYKVAPTDVVHFRFGLDADDPRKGHSPLKSVLREVFTDDEAASFTATLLRNLGVPGLMISPDTDQPIDEADAIATKAVLMAKFSGDKRGEPIVMTSRTKIEQFGFSPEQLLLRELRRIPEERVTAVLGVPAIVAGLGAGLDRSTFTNMAEAREAAYESGIIPMQRILAEEILFQLVSDFEADPFEWRFGFDLSKVRVLQEDLYRQAQRNDLAIRGGWMLVAEGRRAMGLDVVEERDGVFLRPMNVTQVSAVDGTVTPLAPARGAGSNGNGAAYPAEIAEEVVRAMHRDALTAR